MVKLSGPVQSLAGKGSLASILNFSLTKGVSYLRRKPKPTNPKTPSQISIRQITKFLTQHWANLSAADQATWVDPAGTRDIPPYTAYLSTNMLRWRNFLAPGQSYPVTETGTHAAYVQRTATGQPGSVLLSIRILAPNDTWALTIHRSQTSGFASTYANMIHVLLCDTSSVKTWLDTRLAPGLYYYRYRLFTTDGLMLTELSELFATVT